MKSKDQVLLEEAYNKVQASELLKKMVAGSNNPGWTPEQGLTSGQAFKGWEPPGGYSKKSQQEKPKTKSAKKEVKKKEDEEDFDVEGDPIGSYRSVATPEPEPETKVISVPFDFLDRVQTKDLELYQIITALAKNVEQDGNNLNFTYSADHAKNIEYFIQNYNQ